MIDKNEYFKTIRRNIIFEKVTQPMRIRSYFENKKYLVYTDNFRQRILEQSNLVVPGMPDMQFSKDRMLKNCKDENIVHSLECRYKIMATNEQLMAAIPYMAFVQQKGQKGVLSTTEYNNAFYTKDFVITVGWTDIKQQFICDAVLYEERGAKDFIFYPTFIAGSS